MMALIPDNVSHRMPARGWSMAALSGRAGLNKTAVHYLSSGKKARGVNMNTLEKIAHALGVTVKDLLAQGHMQEAEDDLFVALEALPQEQQRLLLETAKAWALLCRGRS